MTEAAGLFVSAHPLVHEKLTRLRDERTPPKIFRELIAEIATLVLYEATSDLRLGDHDVRTPLAPYRGARLAEAVGLVPVLRAGIGMVEAALELIPEAPVWHLGLFRDERTLRPISYYNKLPSSAPVQVCLVLDPMLATGGSAVATVQRMIHAPPSGRTPRVVIRTRGAFATWLSGAELAIARVAKTRDDVALLVQALVERCEVDRHVGMGR